MRPAQPHPGGEHARFRELHRYQILGTEPEVAFERIVDLAQRLFRVPTVLISLVAEDRQWFKARRGFGRCETDLESSFCAHTVQQDEVMVVLDATRDVRFQATPLVTGEPFIRFYAGAPLKTPGGYNLGTLCIIDSVPHAEFGEDARATLADLAALVVESLELRLATRTTREQAAQTQTILESITEAFYTLDEEWRFTYLNTQAQRLLGRDQAELLGHMVWTVLPEALDSDFSSRCVRAVSSGTTATFEYFFAPLNSWFEVHAYPSAEGLSVYFQDIGERKRAEQKLRLQSEFRHNLLSLMQTSLQHDLDRRFYQHILGEAVRLVPGAQAGSLLLKEGSHYAYVAAVGFELSALRPYAFELENGWLDYQNLEPQLIYNWHTEALGDDVRPHFDEAGRIGVIKVSLCLPVVVRDQVAAYFCLDNFDTVDAFDPDATEMARIFAQQTALLVQRLDLEAALRRER